MSDQLPTPPNDNDLPEQLQERMRAFPYPPTPDIAGSVRRRLSGPERRRSVGWRLALAVVVLLVLLFGLLSVPQVRAAVLNFLRLGNVTIYQVTPTPTPPALTTTPRPTPTLIPSLLDLAGETTLADARSKFLWPIGLPTYPANLGAPDKVYLQQTDGQMLILVWLDPAKPGGVRLSLHLLTSDVMVEKSQPQTVQETTVNGGRALWTDGPYLVVVTTGQQWVQRRMIDGHVLIWTDGPLTYRLETDLSLDEAVKIAQSIRRINGGTATP